MSRRLAIAMFVDACGWDVVRSRPSFLDFCRHRQPVESLFGFSSACVPAILSGLRPNQNDHWSAFFYAPGDSPFEALRPLGKLPKAVFDRGRVRHHVSRALAAAYRYTGYFQIYNVPFEHLGYFDYAEKHDIFRPGGLNRGTTIFDDLARDVTPHHVSNWRRSESENVESLRSAIRKGQPRFAFLYTAKLDALMHEHTKDSPKVDEKLAWYAWQIEAVLRDARRHYDEVRFALFSDHGMATVHTEVDWMPRVERSGLCFGRDYLAVYDSTMLRFWFLRDRAEDRIRNLFDDGDHGRWMSRERLETFGTWWPDGKFGHAVYALEPGVLLNPSHMGRVAPAGMHGYRPDHPDSDASLLASFEPSQPVSTITDLYGVMREMAGWAAAD